MIEERQIINLLLEGHINSDPDLHLRLADLGFVAADGNPFNQAQIQSLLHSARQESRKKKYRNIESCGIDRSSNPCGDASDY